MPNALVVDDHPVVRATVKMILEQENFDPVTESGDGVDALEKARQVAPDLVVLDIAMPKIDGLEVIRRIVDLKIVTRVLVLTSLDQNLYLKRCMNAGAAGFISKMDELEDVRRAVKVLMSNHTYFPNLTIRSPGRSDLEKNEAEVIESLSDRQLMILKFLAKGLSNKEIGDGMRLSNKTISTYKMDLIQRFNVTSLIALGEIAKRNGII